MPTIEKWVVVEAFRKIRKIAEKLDDKTSNSINKIIDWCLKE